MKRLWLLIFVIGVVSCQSSPDVPQGVLDEVVMADVVEDLMAKRQDLKYYGLTNDSLEIYFGSFYHQTLAEKSVTDEEFQNSYTYYKSDPELFLSMWTIVTDSLKVKMDEQVKRNSQ